MESEKAVEKVTKEIGTEATQKMFSLRSMRYIRKLYNSLCPTCRERVVKKPDMELKEYCGSCQIKAKPILKNIIKVLEK